MVDSTDQALSYGEGVLRSQRLRLRPVQEADLTLLEQWWHIPGLLPLQAGHSAPRPDGAQLETFRAWFANASSDAGFAVERLEDQELLGAVTLYGATARLTSATFAIQLRPDVSGQGYGTEATRLMVDYGFSTLPLHRIELQVYAFNDRALRCYRSAGFTQEGVRRQVVFVDGQWHDQILMSVLRPEWEATRPVETDATRS